MVRSRHPSGAYSRDTHTLSQVQFAAHENLLYSSQSDMEAVSSVDMGAGAVTSGSIVDYSIGTQQIADNSFTLSKFTQDIRPPVIVSVLPTLPHASYPLYSTVVFTTDGKLYRNVANAWVKAVDGVDIVADSVTAGAIAAGAVGASEIAAGAVTAVKLSVGSAVGPMLTNAGFETGDLTGWFPYYPFSNGQVYTEPVASSGAPYGSGSWQAIIRKDSAAGSVYLLNDPWTQYTCRPGDIFVVSALLANADATLNVGWLDVDQNFISNSTSPVLPSVSTGKRYSWTTGAAPAGAKYARIMIENLNTGSYPSYLVVDDVHMSPAGSILSSADGNVVIDHTGVQVNNGAIVVRNAGATVIIDGTSNMFKIVATGTHSQAVTGPNGGTVKDTTLTALGALSTTPAHLSFIATGNLVGSRQYCGFMADGFWLRWMSSSLNGSATGNGLAFDNWVATTYTTLNGSNECVVSMEVACINNVTFYQRYYILKEAAL